MARNEPFHHTAQWPSLFDRRSIVLSYYLPFRNHTSEIRKTYNLRLVYLAKVRTDRALGFCRPLLFSAASAVEFVGSLT
jgi:hypothetical protein